MLIERIKADALSARKSKSPSTGVLTTLLGEIATAEKKNNPARALTDAEVVAIVQKFLKNNGEALAAVEGLPEARRDVERSKLLAEKAALEIYLPQQMTAAEIEAIARERAGAGDNMGAIMGYLKANYGGQYDGKEASAIVKAVLG